MRHCDIDDNCFEASFYNTSRGGGMRYRQYTPWGDGGRGAQCMGREGEGEGRHPYSEQNQIHDEIPR